MKLYKITVVAFAYVVLASCGGSSEQASPSSEKNAENNIVLTPEQIAQAGITTGKITIQPMQSSLKLNGKIDVPPQNLISVSFPLGGFLKSTSLLPGKPVRKGEIIATIENEAFIQMQQEYLTTKSRYDFLQKDLQRQKELNTTKTASDKTYQQAQNDFETAQISLRALEEKLLLVGLNPNNLSTQNMSRSINLYAPVNGYVSKVNVNIGKFVSPTDVLFEIVDPSDVHLTLTVFENDIHKLQLGQRFVAWTNQDPTTLYDGSIILLGQQFDDSRATEVHCHFDKFNSNLLPGMYMTSNVSLTNNEAFTLPSSAVVQWEGKSYVYEQGANGGFEMVPVSILQEVNGTVELANDGQGLEQKQLVLTNAYALLMHSKNSSEE
jgi:cobalt-zinc-cadmium efflux system membrane fusion protein